MSGAKEDRIEELERRIRELELENAQLRSNRPVTRPSSSHSASCRFSELAAADIERYSRQMLVEGAFGVRGQKKLLQSSVLVIGAGGIGSSALMYLAAAGVGRIGMVDFDQVEVANLHRQVIHTTDGVGMSKAQSARAALQALNPTIEYRIYETALTSSNAMSLIVDYDVIVDASDNPQTRYLVNDACVLGGKPLVSASAVGTEGQLSVYHYKDGPCYRCLYPQPSIAGECRSCSDAGVLGPVPGLVGILQAMEVLKILTDTSQVMSDRLLMYDALQCSFFSIKKPPRRASCPVCGDTPVIRSMEESSANLSSARGPGPVCPRPTAFPMSAVVDCGSYQNVRETKVDHLLLDVRVASQFALCCLPGAVSVPLDQVDTRLDEIWHMADGRPIYCICRRGIASAAAVELLRKAGMDAKHIEGGLTAWQEQVDPSFPKY